MKSRMLVTALVIALAAFVVGGVTLAWFTDAKEMGDVEFAAGTIEIAADEAVVTGVTEFDNVNPGDAFCVSWNIRNVGSKRMELRFDGNSNWADVDVGDNDPAHIAVCPHYDDGKNWKIVPSAGGGFEIYYTGGPIAPEDSVELVLVVAFEGEGMENKFMEKSYTLSGKFEAVQTTNGAPEAVFGVNWTADGVVDDYFNSDGFEWPDCCGGEVENGDDDENGQIVVNIEKACFISIPAYHDENGIPVDNKTEVTVEGTINYGDSSFNGTKTVRVWLDIPVGGLTEYYNHSAGYISESIDILVNFKDGSATFESGWFDFINRGNNDPWIEIWYEFYNEHICDPAWGRAEIID